MINAAQVKHLRNCSGAGMMDVKNALIKSNGDEALAFGFLKVKGLAVYIKGDREVWEYNLARKYAKDYYCD